MQQGAQIQYNIVACLLVNATNNLWDQDLTLDLFDVHQAELQLIITLNIMHKSGLLITRQFFCGPRPN
jgi:hypothetical protein